MKTVDYRLALGKYSTTKEEHYLQERYRKCLLIGARRGVLRLKHISFSSVRTLSQQKPIALIAPKGPSPLPSSSTPEIELHLIEKDQGGNSGSISRFIQSCSSQM